uniref:CDP-alcohol phosphatidyltransferase n=1 Tax=Rhodosorus marinus TaxID=101924 RepID=A0A7S0BKN1_9RHOD|mmetsp:Transcript_18639/g.26990  ORF Transcript_18639/g.26990 Transcript_18639/m.26990 type:complete len:322 (+) Transcript_18639:20-985(+)
MPSRPLNTSVYRTPLLQQVYLLLWIGLASYRILDNLDGRQARRTGSSSPLGHLFDHGCDTLNVFLSGLNCTAALRIGSRSFYSIGLVWLVAMLQFFGATLEEFFNGALNLGYINGPNEGVLLVEAMYLASFVFGPSIWEAPLSIGPWQIRRCELFFWVLFPMSIPLVLTNYVAIWKKAITDNRRGDIVASLRASVPFLLFSFCMVTWQQTSTAFEKHPHLFLWCAGINFFYLISRLIVAHLTKTEFPTVMGVQLVMVVGAANAVAGMSVGSEDGLLDQYVLLWLLLGVELLVNCRRIMGMTREICSHLGIECFRIKSRGLS